MTIQLFLNVQRATSQKVIHIRETSKKQFIFHEGLYKKNMVVKNIPEKIFKQIYI